MHAKLVVTSGGYTNQKIFEATVEFHQLPAVKDLVLHDGNCYEVNYVVHPADGSDPILVCMPAENPLG